MVHKSCELRSTATFLLRGSDKLSGEATVRLFCLPFEKGSTLKVLLL